MTEPSASNARKSKGVKQKAIVGLAECDHFLHWNDCASATYGILSPLLRKMLFDNSLTDIFDQLTKRSEKFPTADDLIRTLKHRRERLSRKEISLGRRCLINRLISHIEQSHGEAMLDVSNHRERLKRRMQRESNFSSDISQWEKDLLIRRKIIEASRLFHVSFLESQNAPHIPNLIDRTTSLLSTSIDPREIFRIIENAFVIVCQPQFNGIPVTIYQSSPTGFYTVKIHVRLVSLLGDFIRTHPNPIELNDIDVSLVPQSADYQIENGQKIGWKTCLLSFDPHAAGRTVDYAEIEHLTIRLTSRERAGVPFARVAHSLKFDIHFQIQSNKGTEQSGKCTLETMPFKIGNHNVQIPELLSEIIWTDLQTILPSPQFQIGWSRHFLRRYFLNRTGVVPNEVVNEYLQSLPKGLTDDQMIDLHQSADRIRSELIVPFISHVELIARNPLLALLHFDGLFLSPCDSIEGLGSEHSPILRSVRLEWSTRAAGLRTEILLDQWERRNGQWSSQTLDTKKLSRPLATLIELQARSDARYRRYFDEKLPAMLQPNRDFYPIGTTDAVDADDSHNNLSFAPTDPLQYFSVSDPMNHFDLDSSAIQEYRMDDEHFAFDVFGAENHLN